MNIKKNIIIIIIISFTSMLECQKNLNNSIPDFLISRIQKDLSCFIDTGITQKNLENTVNKDYFFVRCHIINQEINLVKATFLNETADLFIKKAGRERLDIFLFHMRAILKKIKIPNVDFIISLSDGFMGNANLYNLSAPVFTFSKWDSDEKMVLIPDIEMLGSCDYYIKATTKANQLCPWNKKINKLIWRGLPTGNHLDCCFRDNQRFRAVEMSNIYPDLIDAKYSGVLPYIENELREIIKINGYVGNSLTLNEQINYKYQLYIDGWTNSYSRAFWQLWSNCLMLKPFSHSIQWYYDGLISDVHYVAINKDLSDLKDKIQSLIMNESFVQNVIASANDFAKKYLNKETMHLYIKNLFEEYAKLQKFSI